MKSFLEFFTESKRSDERQLRKDINGYKPPVEDPDLPVIHHDPVRGTTIYHMKTEAGCQKAGSPKWCTTPRESLFRPGYMRRGELYVAHTGKTAHQIFIPNEESTAMGAKPEIKDWNNQQPQIAHLRITHPGLKEIPGFTKHYLNASHLHHFADDPSPEIRHHVAANAHPEKIPLEMTHDPDPDVRATAIRRTAGLKLSPMEKPSEPKVKEQKSFRFGTPKK